jgi:hypothetical protein
MIRLDLVGLGDLDGLGDLGGLRWVIWMGDLDGRAGFVIWMGGLGVGS